MNNKDCLNVWFFNIFFKPETELVVAWLRWSLHPLLVYMVYRPRDLYESDSSPCGQCLDKLIENNPSVSIFFLRKNWTAVQKKPHFINNKQTPEFQENIASFSSV
jgi:hypothetical protein